METDLPFGEWLRRRRGSLGLTRAAFAKTLGCATVTLRKIESEERRPSNEMAERIAQVLELPLDQHAAFVRFARGEMRMASRLMDAPKPAEASGVPGLPHPPYPIIGRDDELAVIAIKLASRQTRLITLIGPPGVGKTRLALEAAHRLAPTISGGAVFVELTALATAAHVAGAVAKSLAIVLSATIPAERGLIAHIGTSHCLIVLDNFEHVLDAAPFVADLIANCPNALCLVTSRERLRLRAEQLLPVLPLRLPDSNAPGDIARAPAARLFAARAQAVDPSFEIDESNAADVADLCRRLDGLPLAIELIAAQAETLTPAEMRSQMAARLPVLIDGPRDLPARQRTLRAAIGWSVDRLSAWERHVFGRLGVFSGGASLDGLRFVLAVHEGVAPEIDSEALDDALDVLVEASIVYRGGPTVGDARFDQLETVREFAQEVLFGSGTDLDARERHAVFFEALATERRKHLAGDGQTAWYARVDDDLDNIRAALSWRLRQSDAGAVLRMISGLYHYWWQRGLAAEGLGWFESGFDTQGAVAPVERAQALVDAGVLASYCNQYEKANGYLLDGLALARTVGFLSLVRGALANLGNLAMSRGDFYVVEAYLEEANAISDAIGEPGYARFTLSVLGDLRYRLGQFEASHDAYTQAHALSAPLQDQEGVADALWGQARAARALMQFERTEKLCGAAHAQYSAMHHEQGMSWVAQVRAALACDQRRLPEALVLYRDALAIRLKHADGQGFTRVLDEAANVYGALGENVLAVKLLSVADHTRQALGGHMTPFEQNLRNDLLARCRDRLGERDWQRAWSDGQLLTQVDALQLIET